MFIYGEEIPLDDVRREEAQEPSPARPFEPAPFGFEYGKDIFPARTDD